MLKATKTQKEHLLTLKEEKVIYIVAGPDYATYKIGGKVNIHRSTFEYFRKAGYIERMSLRREGHLIKETWKLKQTEVKCSVPKKEKKKSK